MRTASLTSVTNQSGKTTRLIVITDLDGTLLDQQTYDYHEGLPAVRRLQSLAVPLILCSSKTHGEILPLWEELKLNAPFIVENGGSIYFLEESFPFPVKETIRKGKFRMLGLGTEISILRKALQDASRQNGVKVRSFGTMTLDEIAGLTGLNKSESALAAQREYDEPFIIEGGDPETLKTFLSARGFTVVKGDRFYHLTAGTDKGRATARLLELFRCSNPAMVSVGLGNSANDNGFLAQVDRPVVIRNPDGTWDAEVIKSIPTIQSSDSIGPQGWREAIEDVLVSVGL